MCVRASMRLCQNQNNQHGHFYARKSLMKTENNANADEIYSLAQQKMIIIKRHTQRASETKRGKTKNLSLCCVRLRDKQQAVAGTAAVAVAVSCKKSYLATETPKNSPLQINGKKYTDKYQN